MDTCINGFVHLVFGVVFISFIVMFEMGNTNAFSANLLQRDSYGSPFYDSNISKTEIIKRAIARGVNKSRIITLNSYLTADLFKHDREYLMKIQLGTPPVDIIGVADTGSDLTWTQCHPCTRSVLKNIPLFYTHASSSYTRILCDSSKPCPPMFESKCQADGYCHYNIRYYDGSYSNGFLSKETLRMTESNHSHHRVVHIPNFKFGCGYDNGGSFGGIGSGVIGLGAGPLSLVTQLAMQRFSYCLIRLQVRNGISHVRFSQNAFVHDDSKAVTIPLINKYLSGGYYVTLEAFTVGTVRIDFIDKSGVVEEGNIIIDSGSTLTELPPHLYSQVRHAVAMETNTHPVPDPYGLLDLCFRDSRYLKLPSIVANFKGGDVALKQYNAFLKIENVICLTFVATEKMSVYGSLAQQNFIVGFDRMGSVSFRHFDCTKF